MTGVPIIIGYFHKLVLGLTPLQRWDAVTKHHSNTATNQWFITVGLVVVGLLTAVILVRIYRREKNGPQPGSNPFAEYAKAKELTDREYRILMDIAVNAGLKRNESIFTLPSTFDRGAARMTNDVAAELGTEQRQQLETELSFLRKKLGFLKLSTSQNEAPTSDATTRSSQEIPVKKKLYIKGHHRTIGDLEATVIKNTSAELTVEFSTPVEIIFGQSWICRYYHGAFVAEFNTTVLKCSDRFVALKHSHNVRLINRRRFLRVPVKTPAYVANFPFQKNPLTDGNGPRKKTAVYVSNPANEPFQPPRFVPATVTELGGPGLRINTHLEATVGDRVLVVFKLDTAGTPASPNRASSPEKVIEDIATIRHITKTESGSSIALEFVDLKDDEINELVRAANEASMGLRQWRRNDSGHGIRNGRTAELLSV